MEKRVAFNKEIALRVFKILDSMWRSKSGIFRDVVLPQDLWVPSGWEHLNHCEKANFLFYAALPMRGGQISEDPFKWLCALWTKFPGLFNPKTVAETLSPKYIEECFKTVTSEILENGGIGKLGGGSLGYKMEQHAKHWHENSTILNTWWGADIRNVFWGIPEFEEAFRRIDHKRTKIGFKGMRRKIFSLLIIWLQEKELIPAFPTPIPVDFHAMRILWQNEIIDMRGWAQKFEPKKEKHSQELKGKTAVRIWETIPNQIAIWSQKFLEKNQISHMVINPALWVLSRTLCAEHLQTSSLKTGHEFFTPEKLKANPGLWTRNRKHPCEFCPIEKFCKWCIPANPYYTDGWLIRIKRISYPTPRLLGIDWIELGPTHKIRKDKNRGAIKS
ncbi:MAG: hypothetical protein A2V60_02950 [Candidatus Portnoybacteria bacterium RIFCSPHIGHO2_01_FULL_39_19]|nr:MAG: hypothetical protein A2V60_02950 [Candidatus Portnoybacteria bacterium RIFCSPHIGHO2_01_FULL_39_19]